MKNNLEIRKAIMKAGAKHWEIADILGIGETTLVRWLRKELPKSEKEKIYAAIEQLRKEKSNHGNE